MDAVTDVCSATAATQCSFPSYMLTDFAQRRLEGEKTPNATANMKLE